MADEQSMGDSPQEGIWIRIPLDECTLLDAYNLVEDPSFWDETMPAILHFFNLTLDGYYDLTVKQHRLLYEFLNASA